MSKSLRRVKQVLAAAGVDAPIIDAGETRTAIQAADACGCTLDQIVKSILFEGAESGSIRLFLTAGGNRIAPEKASDLAGEDLCRADPALVRAATGFAIGGVSPVGHLSPCPVWIDPRLLDFELVWAAAGTPRHVFAIAPGRLAELTDAVIADFTT